MRDLIPDEIKRLIYQGIMGGKVVVISTDDELASERFREFREAIIEAEDKMRALIEEVGRELLIGGRTNGKDPMGIFAEYFELINESIENTKQERSKWYNPKKWRLIREARESTILCRRCRWRPRESRRSLEGLSPNVVIDEEVE